MNKLLGSTGRGGDRQASNTLSISKTAMLLFILRCADGEGRVRANTGPIGIGAAALGFSCRETRLLFLISHMRPT